MRTLLCLPGRVLKLAVAAALLSAGASTVAQRKTAPPPAQMPALPPAVYDSSLEIGGGDIDARRVRTRMTVAVQVEGRGPYRFVVDSGADSSVIGERIARTLGLAAGTPVTLHGMTESSRVERVRVGALGLGQSIIADLQLPVLREVHLGGEGMIGIDALVEQRLMMDFDKRVITIEDAARPAQRLDGEIVVTARRRRGQLILTQASAAGRPVDAVIDTGSEITIGNLALRDRLIRRNADKFKTIAVTGVTGVTVELQLATVAELRVGSVVLKNVPMAFADVPPFAVFGLSEQPALLLGTDFLEKFRRVSLDFGARKVRFQLKRCASSVRIGESMSMARLSLIESSGEICRR